MSSVAASIQLLMLHTVLRNNIIILHCDSTAIEAETLRPHPNHKLFVSYHIPGGGMSLCHYYSHIPRCKKMPGTHQLCMNQFVPSYRTGYIVYSCKTIFGYLKPCLY